MLAGAGVARGGGRRQRLWLTMAADQGEASSSDPQNAQANP